MSRVSEQPRIYRGELGQTARSSVQISTDNGAIFEADVYDALNAADDPELEESLFRGGLNRVESPFSDRIYHPAIPVRYHDPERRLFALVIPEALRHRELQLRRDLLDSLAAESEIVPDYVRNFEVVIGPSQLQHLAENKEISEEAPRRVRNLQERSSPVDAPAASESIGDEVAEAPSEEVGSEELEQEWARLEDERRELEQRREQLDELNERLDRDRSQMDEFEQDLQQERRELESMREEIEQERDELEREWDELEQERQSLEAERLRLEEKQRSLESQPDEAASAVSEETQVVTEDQFVSVAPEEPPQGSEMAAGPQQSPAEPQPLEAGGTPAPEPASEGATDVQSTPDPETADTPEVRDRTSGVEVTSLEGEALEVWPETYEVESDEHPDRHLELDGDVVRATARLDDERVSTLTEDSPECFVQFHDVDDYPIAAIAIARLDDERRVEASFGWPLDLEDEPHVSIWEQLSDDFHLALGLYRESNDERVGVVRIEGPLEDNVEWIQHRLERELEADPDGDFAEAAESYLDPDFKRVGSMRHNFDRQAFRTLATPAQIKLAAGVVGYWSDGEVFDYLMSNRSYPLTEFRDLQEDVVEAALETGIYLNEPLRALALEIGEVDDEAEIAERLMANFAEVTIHIRGDDHDLEPIDEWDNWEALIELAQDVGVPPDPDVLELAEGSLNRARRARSESDSELDDVETDVREAPDAPEPEDETPSEEAQTQVQKRPDVVELEDEETSEGEGDSDADDGQDDDPDDPFVADDGQTQVISHESEATGITYMLPEADVIESFDDLDDMSREDLELLLEDPHGRLEAAQTLLERFDSSVVSTIMDAAESMSSPELLALTRFLEPRAEAFEAELMQALESGGASATSVAIRALASTGSKTALPTILDAYCDSDRHLARESLARTLAGYGNTLVPPLTREIERSGPTDEVVMLLYCLEDEHEGILEQIEDNRDDDVRKAVERARDMSL